MKKGFGSNQAKAQFEAGLSNIKPLTVAPGAEETRGGRIIKLVYEMALEVSEIAFLSNGQFRKIGKLNLVMWLKLGRILLWHIKEIIKTVLDPAFKDIDLHASAELDGEDDEDENTVGEV